MNTKTVLSPTYAMNRVRDGFDRLFDSMIPSFSRTIGLSDAAQGGPALNVVEDDDRIYVEAELPGVSMEDIDVAVADSMLTISGSRTLSSPEDVNALRQERGNFLFERSIAIPANVKIDEVEARMQNGVLKVTLPKAEQSRTRRVAVTAA